MHGTWGVVRLQIELVLRAKEIGFRSITIDVMNIAVTGGRSVHIANDKDMVNGHDVTPEGKDIRIEIYGDVDCLDLEKEDCHAYHKATLQQLPVP